MPRPLFSLTRSIRGSVDLSSRLIIGSRRLGYSMAGLQYKILDIFPLNRGFTRHRSQSAASWGRSVLISPQVSSRCLPKGERPWRRARTRIGDGNGSRVDISEGAAQRRNDGHHGGTGAADDDGPEERGSLAGCPAAVPERTGPEVGGGGGHGGRERDCAGELLVNWFRRRRIGAGGRTQWEEMGWWACELVMFGGDG
jgi:hypothetical protein